MFLVIVDGLCPFLVTFLEPSNGNENNFHGYCWLFYWCLYILLVAILLMAIGCSFIGGY
jgi:hypothetical protein